MIVIGCLPIRVSFPQSCGNGVVWLGSLSVQSKHKNHNHNRPSSSYVLPSPSLPSKALFHKIHATPELSPPNRPPDLIRQFPRATNTDAHGTNLALTLLANQRLHAGSTGKHLDRATGTDDLVLVPGTGDEQLDAQYLSSLLHGQDLRHPRTDPLQVLWGLDDPDEGDAASGDGAGGVAGYEVSDVGDLVGDADAGGEEENGSV